MTQRLNKLFRTFDANKIDALLVGSGPNVTYLSGFKGSDSWLLISPKSLYFITDSRYAEQARKEAKGFKVVLRDGKCVSEVVADLVGKKRSACLGFEGQHTSYAFYIRLERTLGPGKLQATKDLVEDLRQTKDAFEISQIRKSAGIAVRGFHYIKQVVRPGMTEREAQGRLEYFTKSIGAEKPAFDIIIASGARSSMPHCQTNDTIIKDNNLALVDMGVVYQGYHSDLTRPIFLGRISPFHKRIYRVVRQAQAAGIRKAAPGVAVKEVDAACRYWIKKSGYGRYFSHGTGHGVGLQIHEAPTVSSRSSAVLKPGMVITVEPGIYLPGKFGIRIEDMVLITNKGNEVLTRDLDKSV